MNTAAPPKLCNIIDFLRIHTKVFFPLLVSNLFDGRWALLKKPSIVQLLKNFPTLYGTQSFITVFTLSLH
jgi:hypothetical protein